MVGSSLIENRSGGTVRPRGATKRRWEMPESPKLRVTHPGWVRGGDIRELKQAQSLFDNGGSALVTVEGQVVGSYEELVKLAKQEPYKDKEFLEVKLLLRIGGG